MSDIKPNFDLFLRQLKSRKADPILRYIRSFITNFTSPTNSFTTDQQCKLVQDFATFIFEKLTQHEPFCKLNEPELMNAKYGVEKLVMSRIYEHCYSPEIPNPDESHKQDLKVDEKLAAQYAKYSHLEYKELDVDESLVSEGDRFIKIAAIELNKLGEYKAPRAKTICLLNACKVLFQLIKNSNQNQNADEFLPLLVYTCLKGEIKDIYSNLKFIERFSFQRNSEAEYYLVSLNAAVEYIARLGEETEEKELVNI